MDIWLLKKKKDILILQKLGVALIDNKMRESGLKCKGHSQKA